MIKRKVVWSFGLLLFAHVAHILSEAAKENYFIGSYYGNFVHFLIINLLLLSIPIIIFYLVFLKKGISYYLGFIYGAIIVINGVKDIINIKNYFDIYTNVLIIFSGIILIYYLKKELDELKGGV